MWEVLQTGGFGIRDGRYSSMEDGRTNGRTAGICIHSFFFCSFWLEGERGIITTFSTHSTLAGSGHQPDSDLFSFTLYVSVSLLCRFSSCVLIKIPIFLLVVRCVGEEIKLARVGVYIGVLDLPWIGP